MNPTQNSSNTATIPPVSPAAISTPGTDSKVTPSNSSAGNRLPSWLKPLYLIIVICFMILAGVGIWLFAGNYGENFGISKNSLPTSAPKVKKSATISGNILFQGFASSEAYLVVAEKSEGSKDFKSVVTGLVPATGAIPWTWKDAKSGSNYEIQAQLKIKGKTIQTSTSNIFSAPASNVNLVIVSDEQPPAPVTTTVSGTVNINGNIPQGAFVVITADTTSGEGGVTTLPSIAAVDDTNWSWSGAITGTTYDFTAQLVNSQGASISSPVSANITAPSTGLQFNINSTAQPPVPQITGLSGNIIINGSIPSGSYITIGTRVTGTTSFNQIANNISASNNVAWNWSQAQAGTSYDIQAYLWSNNQPFAQSQILSVEAPSDGDTLTINAQQPTSAPGGSTIAISCSNQQGGSYQATINFNTQQNLSNAQSYNIILTLASQGNQVLNTVVTPPNPASSQSLTTTYLFTPGATYYAQYAYSTSSTGNNFSPLSPAIQFNCR